MLDLTITMALKFISHFCNSDSCAQAFVERKLMIRAVLFLSFFHRWKINFLSILLNLAAFCSSLYQWLSFVYYISSLDLSCVRVNCCMIIKEKAVILKDVLRDRHGLSGCLVREMISINLLVALKSFLFPSLIVAVVVSFFLCFAPFHSQRIMAIYGKIMKKSSSLDDTFMKVYVALTYMSGITYFLSTCINPFLYNLMSHKFRNASKVRSCWIISWYNIFNLCC